MKFQTYSRKLPTQQEGQQVYSSSFKLHQSNTLHWVSPLKVTERSGQGELQAQGSGSHHRYYQRHTNELQTRLSISTACFPVEWLAASHLLHFKLTMMIWTSTYFPPPEGKGQTTTSTLFISTKFMKHLENRVQSKNLAGEKNSILFAIYIDNFCPKAYCHTNKITKMSHLQERPWPPARCTQNTLQHGEQKLYQVAKC